MRATSYAARTLVEHEARDETPDWWILFEGDHWKCELRVTENEFVIGRHAKCDLRIPIPQVSRFHCRLQRHGEDLVVTDLGSSNGTKLNGSDISIAIVASGDVLTVGGIPLNLFSIHACPGPGRNPLAYQPNGNDSTFEAVALRE